MIRERECPRCRDAGLVLMDVLSLGGDTVVGRWTCGGCGHRMTRFTPLAALDDVERERVLVPFRRRLEELRAGSV